MKRLQIPPKLVYKKFNVFEKILRTRNCCRNLWKIYFLKNAKKTCKPNNRDLNHDWIRNEILFSTRFIRLALHSAPYSKIKKLSVLVPSLATIDHAIIFRKEILHPSFNLYSSLQKLFRNIHFLPHFFHARDFMSLLHFERKNGTLLCKRFFKHPLFATFHYF